MMRIRIEKHIATGSAVVLLLSVGALVSPALAQSGGDYDLSWSTIDGGGGTSSGGDYVLSGTIGQSDAGQMTTYDYHLSGGFWFGPGDMVDLDDLVNFVSQWLESGDVEANLNWDGNPENNVDLDDFSIFASYWLCYCSDDWPL